MQDIYQVLKDLKIDYVRHDHPAVYTVDEAQEYYDKMNGAHTKNLFLRNKKGNKHFLVSVPADKRVDIKSLSDKLGTGRLSFASSERLKKYLDLTPGSVTLLSVINDESHEVQVVIDNEIWQSDIICCHPNTNTATLEMKCEDLQKLFEHTGHEVIFLEL